MPLDDNRSILFYSFLFSFSLNSAQNYEIILNLSIFSLLTFHFSLLFCTFVLTYK